MFYTQFQAQEKLLVTLLLLVSGIYGFTDSALLKDKLFRLISSPEVSAEFSDNYISQTDGNYLKLINSHKQVCTNIQYRAKSLLIHQYNLASRWRCCLFSVKSVAHFSNLAMLINATVVIFQNISQFFVWQAYAYIRNIQLVIGKTLGANRHRILCIAHMYKYYSIRRINRACMCCLTMVIQLQTVTQGEPRASSILHADQNTESVVIGP